MKIKCPSCQSVLNIPPSAAGKLVKCPCGKQLRAPNAPAGNAPAGRAPAATAGATGAASKSGPVAKRPAAATAFDDGLIDELTEGDLKPIAQQGMPGDDTSSGSGNASKLLSEHAATAGGGSGQNFRVGPLASPWVRLGAAMIDGFIINLMMLPALLLCMFFVIGMIFDIEGAQAAMDAAATDEERAYMAGQVMGMLFMGYGLSCVVGGIVPAIVYGVMVARSGQTPGKKLCKIRIVTANTKQLPGFMHGMFLRGWVPTVIYCIPFLGGILMLVDWGMIFGRDRQCLHDRIAGTIVVAS